MNKLLLTNVLMIFSIFLFGQKILVFKKGDRSIQYFYQDSYISIELKNGTWFRGLITKITDDSLYLKKEVIQNTLFGADTTHISGYNYLIKDIIALPKKGVQLREANGGFEISKSSGHMHWYWIKSGWVFLAGATGYAALNLINGIIDKDFTFKGSKLGIATAVFAGGAILKATYRLTLPIGSKYRLETFNMSK